MVESAEGIGSRKWSLFKDEAERLMLMQGKTEVASIILPEAMSLLVTAPQLWDAANELVKAYRQAEARRGAGKSTTEDVDVVHAAQMRLANMVAKGVGKDDWTKVLQS